MRVLFVHRAFPAQFRYVAPRLAARGWECTFVARDESGPGMPGVCRIGYAPSPAPPPTFQPCGRLFETALAHALGVYDALKKTGDVRPDLIVAHGSFGSSLFLPHLFDAPIINFFEYYYRSVGQDLGYRPEAAVTELDLLRCDVGNAMTLLDLANCDRAWAPSRYQRDLMPPEFRSKFEVVHDGIDTDTFHRRPDAHRRPTARKCRPVPAS